MQCLFMEETKINYNKEFEKEVACIKQSGKKPTLLLHVCCGPCFTYPYEMIKEYFDITIIYNNSNIYLYYRSYVGVNNLSLFTEHSIDHITYSKKISEVKNTILFISWILYLFLSLFLYLKKINVKRKWINYTLIIFFVITIIFNFLFCVHVCGVFLRVKGIIKTVDLEGLKYYKTGFKWFIYLNCLIEIGLILDFIFKFNQYKIGKNDINIIINNNLSLIK